MDEVAGAAVGQALVTHTVEITTCSSRSIAKAANLLKFVSDTITMTYSLFL